METTPYGSLPPAQNLLPLQAGKEESWWGEAKKGNSQVLLEFENHCYQQEKRDFERLIFSYLTPYVSLTSLFPPTLNPI